MLHLIITILLTLEFPIESGNHFTMNSKNAEIIKHSVFFNEVGGESEFSKFIAIDDNMIDDIVIVDDDNPTQ